jgi:hypothetical protein
MEKYLTKTGVYEDFQHEFKVISGEDWVDRRNTFYFDADYVIGALTKVTSMSEESARHWFENGVHHYEISIENFAKEVKEYIDKKGSNFHLIFLVDEIGQYIGDSHQLKLNLQTVTEDLGTYCKGKVWIMVTAQESIDSIIKVKGDGFSRIQGRFDTRLSLSSVSVDEVIKKRILLKKDYAMDMLKLLYHEKSAILKNLISFKDATADFMGFSDEKEFADVYPFLPYQFKLLQLVFEQVRKHGSTGKNLSEGERSMLSAFQESGVHYKEENEGVLVPLYAFYDTIKEFLNPSIVRVIEGAYVNSSLKDDEFNANVLKILFLLKYIKELPANIENIATLMVTSIDEDKLALKEKIAVSLRKLILEKLILQNGEIFMFLTDDEQDVNREIKAIKVDEDLVKKELADLIFADLYEGNKYKYSTQYTFTYNQKMDEKNRGSQNSVIGINILSPLSDHYSKSDQELMLMTSGSSEMMVKLGANEAYTEEMEETLKIREYLNKKNISQQPENIQSILITKRAELRERQLRVRGMLEEALSNCKIFINGNKLDVKGSTVKDQLNAAFHELVDNVYTKLGFVKKFLETLNDLNLFLKSNSTQITLDGSKSSENTLAVNEMLDFITLQDSNKNQVRVKILLDRFSAQPYGWKELDIAGLIAELLKEQRIRLRYNAEYLEPEDNVTFTALTKASEVDKVIVLKRVNVDEALLKTARNVCKEVFNKTDVASDEDGLLKDIRQLIDEQVQEIHELKSKYEGRKYPGKSLLDKGIEYFGEFTKGQDSVSFFTKLRDMENQLLEWEKDISYVKSFFQHQKEHFNNGLRAFERYSENKGYLKAMPIENDANQLQAILNDPVPYNKIKDIPGLVNKIDTQIQAVLEEQKVTAKDAVQQDYDYLNRRANQDRVSNETKSRIQSYYDELFKNIDGYKDIFKVDASIVQSANFRTAQDKIIDQEMDSLKKSNHPSGSNETIISPKKERVKVSHLLSVRTLRTEEDVDQLLDTVSAKLKQMIKDNKQIELSIE